MCLGSASGVDFIMLLDRFVTGMGTVCGRFCQASVAFSPFLESLQFVCPMRKNCLQKMILEIIANALDFTFDIVPVPDCGVA